MAFLYPWGNTQELNLDWIIRKIKELENAPAGSADVAAIANALLAATYSTGTAYNVGDIVYRNQKLYMCNTAITSPGETWTPSHWDEVLLGDAVAELIQESDVGIVQDVRYNSHKIQQKKAGSYTDVIPVEDTPTNNSDRLASSKAAYDLKGAINNILSSSTKVLMIGDSYNNGNGGIPGQGWGYYLQQYSACNATIVHQNGGGFAAIGNSNADYPNKTYAQLVADISATDYDLVIAQSGWNDASTGRNPNGVPDIVTGVNNFISAAKTKFTKAKIIIIPTYSATAQNLYQESCLNAIANTALINGVRTSKKSRFWMQAFPTYTDVDTIHLTDDGYQQLAKMMFGFINGWDGNNGGFTTPAVTILDVEGITVQENIENYKYDGFAVIKFDVTLTEPVASWTNILSGLAPATSHFITTITNWDSTFRRNIRVGVGTTGLLDIRYGAAGSYRVMFWYPTPIDW